MRKQQAKSSGITIANGPFLFPAVVPDDVTRIVAVEIPGDDYWVVVPPEGQREALVDRYSLEAALVTGNAIVPVWSDPDLLVRVHGLAPLVTATMTLMAEVFGPSATLALEIVHDPDSGAPTLVMSLRIGRDQGDLRRVFSRRYARETILPENAPIPVILWEYADTVPA